MSTRDDKGFFTEKLLQWNETINKRPMPWKGEKDPYKIWLSEIILQQTRLGQGWDYYNRFIQAFPGIRQLANAIRAVSHPRRAIRFGIGTRRTG